MDVKIDDFRVTLIGQYPLGMQLVMPNGLFEDGTLGYTPEQEACVLENWRDYGLESHYTEVDECKKFLRLLPIVKNASAARHSSYGLKHRFERYATNHYVCNGSIILALAELKVPMWRINGDKLNTRVGITKTLRDY